LSFCPRRVAAGAAALPFTLLQLALDIYYGFSMLATETSKLYLVANCLLYLSINVIGLLSSYLNELNARSFFLRGTCRPIVAISVRLPGFDEKSSRSVL